MMFERGYSANTLANPPALPLFHSTTGRAIDQILESGHVRSRDKNFSLTCLSYGKPSYAFKLMASQEHIGRVTKYSPFCFIFDSKAMSLDPRGVSAYCFDIGGVRGGYYEPEISRKADQRRFQIGSQIKEITLACRELYENNQNYVNARPRLATAFGAFITDDIVAYLNIVKKTGNHKLIDDFDPCSHTFEVRVPSPLQILTNAIALVGKQSELSRMELQNIATDLDIELIPYETTRGLGSLDSWRAILSAVEAEFPELYSEAAE